MVHNGDAYEHPHSDQIRASVDEALSVAITFTPRDALEAKEPRQIDEEDHAENLRVAVRVRTFVLMAEFLSAGVSQALDFELRSLILLRAAAPRVLWDRYEFTPADALKREAQIRKRRSKTRVAHAATASLSALLKGGIEEEEHELAHRREITPVQLRREMLESLCADVAKDARKLTDFPKIALAVLRRAKLDYLEGLGESQADISRKLGEQRATVSAREIRVVETPLKAAGVKGVHLLGGTKSDSHRAACAEAQMGNRNRSDGEARKRGELVDDDDGEAPVIDEDRAKRVAELRRAAEQRRLIALFGEGVAGCDPERTLPMRLVG